MSSEATVSDHPDSGQYEIAVDGDRVGLLTYRLGDGVITFLHAEVDPASQGHGLGSQLAREALDDARARGLAVRPRCPFVRDFIDRHPGEYGDLVA